MIICASRRTDIPTYYSTWLFNRIHEGFVYVRNPFNEHQVSRISLKPDVVDGIVFWTKNPIPMMDRLDELEGYNYYFQFTVSGYGTDVEPRVPSKLETVVPAFQRLSRTIGKERVVWRYDPIFLNDVFTVDFHCKRFSTLAARLAPYTEKCTVSFIDFYRNTKSHMEGFEQGPVSDQDQRILLERFVDIADAHGIYIDTCAETGDFASLGVQHAACVERARLERIGGYKLDDRKAVKDKGQRPACGCMASTDIGAYDTCRNGCLYCYAAHSFGAIEKNTTRHDPTSPLLLGWPSDQDTIHDRSTASFVVQPPAQTSLFDETSGKDEQTTS